MSFKRSHPIIDQFYTPGKKDRKKTIQMQKSYQLMYHEAQIQKTIKLYKKIKYQGFIYEINDFLELYQINSAIPYVVKLKNIISINKENKNIKRLQNQKQDQQSSEQRPFLEVEWYMKKFDISDQKIKKYYSSLSNHELFASGQLFYLPIQSIIKKCQVLSMQQYSMLGYIQGSIYFNRAKYNNKTKQLTPQPSSWDKICQCNMPYNPDMHYIQCQQCNKWYHSECTYKNIHSKQQQTNFVFVCVNCMSKNKNKK